MTAEQARALAEEGSINTITKLIAGESKKGFTSLDISEYDILITDTVVGHFEKNGYKISGSLIQWS